MIVTTKEGRRRSVKTPDELRKEALQAVDDLTDSEREFLMAMMEASAEGEEDYVDLLFDSIYEREPVSMAQFIQDPYYLGESCETLYPEVRKDLIALFEGDYLEVILTGGIGVAKTTTLSIGICRILYELSCMKNPQRALGMSPGSELVIPLISKNLNLAKKVMKTAIDDKIKLSPYFMNHFTPSFRTEETIFPSNVQVVIGSYSSDRVLGTNVIAVALDETNFPPHTKKQQITTGYGEKKNIAHYDLVEKVYTTMVRRIKSRFQRAGGDLPGMVILASSATTTNSFTERHIRDKGNAPEVFVRDHTSWTIRPPDFFSGEKFRVLCSASSVRSRILQPEEEITKEFLDENEAYVMNIPIEYYEDFISNLEDSLRDIGGLSTQAISPYLQRLETIDNCTNKNIPHPFSVYEWTAGGFGSFKWDILCENVTRRLPGGFTEDGMRPRRNPKALRWVHIDTSLSGDSTGMAVGHIERWVEVLRRDNDGRQFTDMAPYIVIDMMLRINPPVGEQIYMPDIRSLVYAMMENGFDFMGASTDSYQSAEMHQQLKRRGLYTELISMDKTTEPYDDLKAAFYEGRIEIYDYEPFSEEMKALEYDREKGKVDHPLAGSKDTSDAVAGVVNGLLRRSKELPAMIEPDTTSNDDFGNGWVTGSKAVMVNDQQRDAIESYGSDDDDFVPFIIG